MPSVQCLYLSQLQNYYICIHIVAGQAVPAGSHVRLNLQTGQREAKLGVEEYLPGRKRYGRITLLK